MPRRPPRNFPRHLDKGYRRIEHSCILAPESDVEEPFVIQFFYSALHGFDILLHLPEPALSLVLIQAMLRLFGGKNSTVANPSGFKTFTIRGDGPKHQIERFAYSLLPDLVP